MELLNCCFGLVLIGLWLYAGLDSIFNLTDRE